MHVAQVRLEAAPLAERQYVDQAQVVLPVDVLEAAVVVAGAQLGRPGVAAAGKQELVAGRLAAEDDVALAAVEGGHLLVVRRIALVDPVEPAGIEGQAVDLLALQPGAAKGLRQQATVVAHHHRQQRLQGAEVQGGGRQPRLGRQPGRAVVVLGTVGRLAVALQKAGADAVGAGVELHAEQADGVEPEAERAFGVARFHFQHEALRPFLGLGLAVAGAKIAVHVEVAQIDAGLAVLDEGGAGRAGDGQGEGAGEQRADGSMVQSHGVSSCCCSVPALAGAVCARPQQAERKACQPCGIVGSGRPPARGEACRQSGRGMDMSSWLDMSIRADAWSARGVQLAGPRLSAVCTPGGAADKALGAVDVALADIAWPARVLA